MEQWWIDLARWPKTGIIVGLAIVAYIVIRKWLIGRLAKAAAATDNDVDDRLVQFARSFIGIAIFFVAFLFLSGFAVPLQMLPAPVQTLAQWLPFYRMLGFPVDLVLNRLSTQQIIFGFAAQFGWLAIALLAVNVVWSRGVREYSAVGA